MSAPVAISAELHVRPRITWTKPAGWTAPTGLDPTLGRTIADLKNADRKSGAVYPRRGVDRVRDYLVSLGLWAVTEYIVEVPVHKGDDRRYYLNLEDVAA